MGFKDKNQREKCRMKLNQIFDLHQSPWRMADGEFFKLDADFMGERLAADAHDVPAASHFSGAAQKDVKSRQKLVRAKRKAVSTRRSKASSA
jgi:hypothetical protein